LLYVLFLLLLLCVSQDASQYPGFPSNYWYPQSQSTPHYANAYPSGTEMQPAYNPQVHFPRFFLTVFPGRTIIPPPPAVWESPSPCLHCVCLVFALQAVPPGAYPNGHGVYNPAQGHYSASNFHPSNPFYCADQMPQRAAPGPYPSQGCPPEQSGAAGSGQPRPVQHHHYTGPHCQAVGPCSSRHDTTLHYCHELAGLSPSSSS